MKRLLALLTIAAASLFAQARESNVPPRAKPVALPPASAAKPAPVKTSAAPSYKDLKYPALRAIQIPKVATYTLPNGMKLYLLEDHELPLINGSALVRTGNLFDPPEKIGLATLTGMVMRTGGTAAKTGEQFDEQLENIAASVETGIGETSGSVGFSALKENADEVLEVFKDVLTAPQFRQEKIDLAKTQISSGISRRNDDASGILQREFSDIIYGKDNPYGWREEYATIGRINRSDLQAFYRRYFFPANVMLAVRGDFDTAAMKARIEKLFAGWTVQQPPVPEFPKVGAAPKGGTYLAVKKDVTQTFFALGQRGGTFKEKDYPALEIMGEILGGGFQSRLVQRVRTQMGNAYNISAAWGANFDHPGIFQISGSTKSLSTVETLKAIREEVDRIRTNEVTEAELKTAKETALNSLIFAFDTKAKTLNRLITYEYYGYPGDFIDQYQKALAAVSRADVLRVAKQYLDPAKFVIVAVGNPPDFGSNQLDTLGSPVTTIDLTIAEPKAEPSKADAGSLARGKELLAGVQKAVGGADKLAAIKDYTQVILFELSQQSGGMKVMETDQWLAPDYIRQESSVPTGRMTAYWDGTAKLGWFSPGGERFGPLAGSQLKQVQGDLFRVYPRLLLSDRIEGRTVNAVDDRTIEISGPNGEQVRIVVNPSTGLPVQLLYRTGGGQEPPTPVQEDLSDYREVNGIKIPHKSSITQAGQKFADASIVEIKMNTGLQAQNLEKRQ